MVCRSTRAWSAHMSASQAARMGRPSNNYAESLFFFCHCGFGGHQTHVARLVRCSSLLLCGWDKTLTKTNLEREGSFSSQIFVVYQGGKSKSELKARAGKRNQGGTLLPGLSPWLAQLPFLYKPGPPAQACCHPQCSGLTSSISSNPESALVA